MDEYKPTDVVPTRTYIIEDVWYTISDKLDHRYAAYRQDQSSFENRGDRCLGFGDAIGELAIYVALHYPGARLVGVWPPGGTDGSELTNQVLRSLGLPISATPD